MKSNSNIRPAAIEPLGNGAYHYNYNIVERQEIDPETGEVRTVYDYDTVKVWNEPTYAKLVKAVIRKRLDETQEFNIINEYNAGVLGVITDKAAKDEATQAYKDYLTFLAETKAMVKKDLEAEAAGND